MTALTNPTSRRRGTRAAAVTAELDKLHVKAATLTRSRWPNLDADDVARRVVLRLRREREAGQRQGEISIWLRNAVYELVVRDQRADRGNERYYEELTVLLHELATPTQDRIRRDLLIRAVGNLHARDVAMLQLTLLGHCDEAVAERLGVRTIEVERAYDRGRARLRAAIENDWELREALRRARVSTRPMFYSLRRPRPRGPVSSRIAPQVQAPVGAG